MSQITNDGNSVTTYCVNDDKPTSDMFKLEKSSSWFDGTNDNATDIKYG